MRKSTTNDKQGVEYLELASKLQSLGISREDLIVAQRGLAVGETAHDHLVE